ncbi:lipoprotein [Enterococcus florum]|uniref:Lipoprotein n=1 Tax=Enterococcus florum TaxID=2480627 RepID=A0A4P5PDB1_9ENTE|nr:lipoprotein [Enterococcus florum]
MRIIKAFLVLLAGVLMLSACGDRSSTNEKSTSSQKTEETVQKSDIPTLFIHGYGGTINSFGGMIQRMEKQTITKKEAIITVMPDGSLQTEGTLTDQKNNPSIQVLFSDNVNNEWNQTEWIYQVMKFLKEQGIEKVNVVGHSMGGVSSLRYLTTYGQPEDAPEIVKFVAIGSPFNDFVDTSAEQDLKNLTENGPAQESSRYTDYRAGINNLPKKLPILLIGGKLSEEAADDGTVPLSSALSIRSLLKSNGNPVSLEIFTGEKAQHSQLHENTDVDKKVANFLWKE